jgi:YVTN family beta-propeller protein
LVELPPKSSINENLHQAGSYFQARAPLGLIPLGIAILSLTTTLLPAAPSNTVVATIPLGTYAGSLVVSPDSSLLYAGENDNKTVQVINTSTNAITATIAVGNLPYAMAITPDGKTLYVTNSQDNTVSVISTANNAVTTTLTVQQYPWAIAISPNGTYAYVANHSSDNISIIDTTTNQVLSQSITVDGHPNQVVFSDSGDTAYVTSDFRPKVYELTGVFSAINTSTQTIIFSNVGKTGGYLSAYLVVSPKPPRMFIIRYTSIKSFNTQTNRNGEQFTIPGIGQLLGLCYTAITPDGKYVYIPNGESGVEMVEIATRTATTFQAGPLPSAIAIAPNCHYAYISGIGDQIDAVDISGS